MYLFWFGGRFQRLDWWLVYWGLVIPEIVLAYYLSTTQLAGEPTSGQVFAGIGLFLCGWAQLVATIKRLHDTGHSGWWSLVGMAPLFGVILLTLWCGFVPGEEDINRFGVPPQYLV